VFLQYFAESTTLLQKDVHMNTIAPAY